MKQYITVKQLNEMEHNTLEYYREVITTDSGWQKNDRIIADLTTIGKMIEIIDSRVKMTIEKDLYDNWVIYLGKHGMFTPQKELTDVLWSVTKFVLRGKYNETK